MFGHCRLERKLGEGGMGVVYLATHTTLNKYVAVKVLRRDLNSDLRAAERFLREARSAARIEHPGVVQVYDIGQADGTFFIVMQYVEGTTLDEAVKKHGALPVPEAARIMGAICSGVREAHQSGVIHRDIKPDNILLGLDGSVKLADFGLARAIESDPNLSQTGRVFGTPNFMSPEQAMGEKVDHRSDIFSLGATFYRVVTGRYPFQATTVMAVVFKLTHENPRPAAEVNPNVPKAFSDLLVEMMARHPAERIGSIDEVLLRLELFSQQMGQGKAAAAAAAPAPAKRQAAAPASHQKHKVAPQTRRVPTRPRKSPWRILWITAAAMAIAGFLVLHRQGMIPGLRPASARSAPEKGEPVIGGTAPEDAPPPGSSKTEDAPASSSPQASRAATPSTPATPTPPAESEEEMDKKGLTRRVGDLLADVKQDSSRISKYFDPQGRDERAEGILQRMCAFLFEKRPEDAPPIQIGEIRLSESGRWATVTIQGLGRPMHLRWGKRGDEWYLTIPRRAIEK